jgi:hypothetical protein
VIDWLCGRVLGEVIVGYGRYDEPCKSVCCGLYYKEGR